MNEPPAPLPYATPPMPRVRAPWPDVTLGWTSIALLLLSCLLGIPGGPADWWEQHLSLANAVAVTAGILFILQCAMVIWRVVLVRRHGRTMNGWLLTACVINSLWLFALLFSLFERPSSAHSP